MPRSYLALPAAFVLGALAAGCGAGDPAAGRVTVDTLETGIIHVRNADGGAWRDGEGWRAVELLRIGEMDGEEPYIFGQVRDVRLGADGRVYVLDNQARQVRVFDAAGRHLRTVGREGEGPGEFRNPTGMAWGPDGDLWVVDVANQRHTVLTPDGELATTYPRRIGGYGFHWEGGFDADGRLYEPSFFREPGTGESRRVYIRHEIRGDALAVTDTFELPSHEGDFYRVDLNGGYTVFGVPFAPGLSWRFDGRGGYWIGTGESYRLVHRELDGDTLRIVELGRERAPVTAGDRAWAREWVERILDGRAGLDQVDLSRIPDHKPAFESIVLDDRGWIWVQQTPAAPPAEDAAPEPTRFDVFDPDGRYHGVVEVDVRTSPPPVIVGDRVAGVVRDELGVQRVVVYRLEGRGARGEDRGR